LSVFRCSQRRFIETAVRTQRRADQQQTITLTRTTGFCGRCRNIENPGSCCPQVTPARIKLDFAAYRQLECPEALAPTDAKLLRNLITNAA
jgi:hypothetical protein